MIYLRASGESKSPGDAATFATNFIDAPIGGSYPPNVENWPENKNSGEVTC